MPNGWKQTQSGEENRIMYPRVWSVAGSGTMRL